MILLVRPYIYILIFVTLVSDLDFENTFRGTQNIFRGRDDDISDEYLKGLLTYLLRTLLALCTKTKLGV